MIGGKGYYIWQIPRIEGGNPSAIANLAVSAALEHVFIKIADGVNPFNLAPNGADLAQPLVAELQRRGVVCYGWHYVYGNNPVGEANKAVQRIQQTGVTGYIIDAETEYKQPGKKQAAVAYMKTLRSALGSFPLALSSFRFPTVHQDFPWQEFLTGIDMVMPQVYWIGARNAAEQLNRTITEYRARTQAPLIPTGAAFAHGAWTPTTAEVVQFMQAARSASLAGVNFWEWYTARQIPNMWETIAGFDYVSPAPPPAKPVVTRVRINSLNVRSGPATGFPRVGALAKGAQVTVFNLHQGWAKISPDQERWVYSVYLDRTI